MSDKKNFKNALVGALLILVSLGSIPQAQARDGGGHGWGHSGGHGGGHFYVHHPYPAYGSFYLGLPAGYISVGIGGWPYYYYDGIYYRRYSDRYVVVPAPIGVVVEAPPVGCYPVLIGGVTYYTGNGIYYRYTNYGYEVVPEPRVVPVATVAAPAGPYAGAVSASGEKVGVADVIVLTKAGLSDDAIIGRIIDSGAVFHLSVEEVESMRQQGVSSRVVNFMLSNRR